jgi:hypothetical protein
MNSLNYQTMATILFLVVVAFLFVVSIIGLNRGLGAARPPRHTRVLVAFALGMVAWLGAIAFLSYQGVFANFDQLPPPVVMPAILMVGFTVFLAMNKQVGNWIDALPLYALIWPQAMRIVVEIVLFLLGKDGIAPPQMTWEGLNFDVVAGLTAPVVAFAAFGAGRRVRWLGIVWNIVGLGLLINIVTIAVISTPTFGLMQPANTFVAYWPLIWLPTFVVPAALVMHVLSLRQLIRHKA